MRCRVKICGVTTPEDAVMAAEAGADAIGLVFHPPSRRCVTVDQAARIVASLPPMVTAVGLFLDADAERVRDVISQVALDLLQFHGSETPGFCERFGHRYLKAIGMAGGDPWAVARDHPQAAGLLLDGHPPGAAGGSGEAFDWGQPLPGSHRIIVAGGLRVDNVAQAVQTIRPWGVDCSSGVESSPGIKDRRLVAAFIEEVHRVQRYSGD
ncbi:phosphoribosylanthranilate isomerase [Spiribacter curvatus]|uniref:phosphoribosylanthranilate isomerase n=1 Tax=Spiribacter curvatus TaxID=1335757 RepID=UPI00059E6071|nr:phosphoribosylanthranilate isomerase [Spiribacter curvatus]